MKRSGKIFLSLIAFFTVQVLSLGLFFWGIDIDLSKEYKRSAQSNFDAICAVVENSVEDLDSLEIFSTYTFKNIVVIEHDGYVLFAAKDTDAFVKGSKLEINGITMDQLFGQGGYAGEGSIGGIASFIISKDIGGVAVIAYENISNSAAFIQTQTFRLIIIGAVQIITAAVILSFYKASTKHDEIEVQDSNSGFYIIKISGTGKIIKSGSKSFLQNFDVDNLVEYVEPSDIALAKILSQKLPFAMLLADNKNEMHHFDCISSRKSYGYRILALDSTKQYTESKRISEQIFLEPVTGLRNKTALEMDFEQSMKHTNKEQSAIAIFNIKNLDNLKTLFSQNVKTELLKKCSILFKDKYSNVKELYYCDDSKFVILALTTALTEELKQSINEFNSNLNAIMRIDHNDVQIITDVIFLYLDNKTKDVKLTEIFEYNEYLMLNIKNRVKSNVVAEFFTKSKYYHAIGNKKELTKKIIDEDNFKLFFQPQFRISDGRLVAFEALVRLNEISMTTQDFILISEVNGFMLQLGEQILKKAFNFARMIRTTGLVISINLSPIQLLNKGFVDNFIKSYKEYELKDNTIALEITETFLMSDIEENILKLQILHDNKICIHLDDFGMGYSSLAYLKNLPIDSIKIDREFVGQITTDMYSQSICKFITMTATQLGMTTIAEGVEKPEQRESLKEIGCDFIQGYLTGKAMSEDDTIRFIDNCLKSYK